MHWPGIEPGPPAWQASILPLNHQCLLFNKKHFYSFKIDILIIYFYQYKKLCNHKGSHVVTLIFYKYITNHIGYFNLIKLFIITYLIYLYV